VAEPCYILHNPFWSWSNIPTAVLAVSAEGDGMLTWKKNLEKKHADRVHRAHMQEYEKLVATGGKWKEDMEKKLK